MFYFTCNHGLTLKKKRTGDQSLVEMMTYALNEIDHVIGQCT